MKALCLALLAPLALSAQENTGFRYGLSLGAAATTGQARDFNDRTRLDVGGHVIYGMEKGFALRGSLHLLPGNKYKTTHLSNTYERTIAGSQLMAEGLYYLGGRTGEGFYLSAGLGVDQERCDVKWQGGEYKNTRSRIAPTLGGGYDFNRNMGVSLRYVHGQVEPKDPVLRFDPARPSMGTLSAAFRYTF